MKLHLTITAAAASLLLASCADQPTTANNTAASTNPARRDYSRSDLQRSGRQNTGDAIQATDPSVTISNGGGSGSRQ